MDGWIVCLLLPYYQLQLLGAALAPDHMLHYIHVYIHISVHTSHAAVDSTFKVGGEKRVQAVTWYLGFRYPDTPPMSR